MSDELRYCRTCHTEKPIGEFEFIDGSHTNRRYQCYACRKNIREHRVETRSQRKLREELMAAFQSAASGERANVAAFSEFLESMLGLAGGPHGLAEMYFDCLLTRFSENPGSKTTLDAFRDFFKLWQSHDSGAKNLDDFAKLSSEDVEDRLLAAANVVMKKRNLQIVDTDGEVSDARVG